MLQPNGVVKAFNAVALANDYEKKLLEACYKGLSGNISKGVEFAQGK